MEQKFLNERKQMDEQYNEYRKRLTNELEQIKKKNNELELTQKVHDSEYDKNMSMLKDQLSEAEMQRDSALKQLKSMEASKGNTINQIEERSKLRERELESQLEEKEQEIEDLIQENNTRSEQKLNELKKLHDDEKERLDKRIEEQK